MLIGTAGPGHAVKVYEPCDGLIAANRACSRLVFLPEASVVLHIYDAASLEMMSIVRPEPGCLSVYAYICMT